MSIGDVRLLSADEIEETLYLVRVNEAEELQAYLRHLADHKQYSIGDVLTLCVDDRTKNTILHYCAANGYQDLLQSLLASLRTADKADFINAVNDSGNTALHWAALNGHLDVVKALTAAGADMWIRNGAGHLAMFEAERADKPEVVQYLLEVGGKEVEHTGAQSSVEDAPEQVAEDLGNGVDITMTTGEQDET